MGKNAVDLRFAVVDDSTCATSTEWRMWMTKHGDIYVTTRGLGGITKYSFHKSGVCRDAFTVEHGRPEHMPDRAVAKWQRPDVPQKGSDQFARLMALAVPTDYLSKKASPPSPKITRVPAAPAGHATVIDIGLVRDGRHVLEAAVHESAVPSGLLCFHHAYDEYSVFARWHHSEWENRDINLPASPEMGAEAGLQFLASDGLHERPIRLVSQIPVKDREALMLTELGGRIVPGQEHLNWVARSPGVVREPSHARSGSR